MDRVKDLLDQLTFDQKRFITGGFFLFLLLIVYGISKQSDSNEKIVTQPKKESFKNGDLVSNNASDYYKNKGKHLSKQYENVLSSQKLLEDQLKKIQVALEKSSVEREKSRVEMSETDKTMISVSGAFGKK